MYPMPPILNRYFYTRALGTLPLAAKCGLHGRYYRLLFKAAKNKVQTSKKMFAFTSCEWALTPYSTAFGFSLLVCAPFPINLLSFLSLVLHHHVAILL